MSNAIGGPAAGVGGLSDLSSLIHAWVLPIIQFTITFVETLLRIIYLRGIVSDQLNCGLYSLYVWLLLKLILKAYFPSCLFALYISINWSDHVLGFTF